MRWDTYGQRKPDGPSDWYVRPDPAFDATCPFAPNAADEDAIAAARFPDAPQASPLIGRFEAAYVGHVAEADYRANGSSGGMVSWVAAELLRTGVIDAVAHVVPTDPAGGRLFAYRLSSDAAQLAEGAKSRYYPTDLADVIRTIRSVPGRYAVVGVPCFIKAINLLRRTDPVVAERVTHTLGLFCGHMKSAALVESFAWQLDRPFDRVSAVDYRLKDASRPANWYRAHLTLADGSTAGQDWWHLADGDWGAGFFQNSACNMCDDVVAETADVAFGDAWVEPYSSDGRGTNVVIVRSPALHAMIEQARGEGRLTLDTVDAAFIENTQAAGLRHRREGLAYRLTWRRTGITPVKRVAPNATAIPWRRRLVYRIRATIAYASHRVFRLARSTRQHGIYTRWARSMLSLYAAITWSRGPLGTLLDRLEGKR
jgi:coenzyme F420-reducing hydrogenase beta subunit